VLSLDKALSILACVAEAGQVSLTEISRRLELHPTIVSRMLETLAQHGYVQQLGQRGKFAIGITPLVLANAAVAELPLRKQALPILQWLADSYRVATNLAILHNGRALYLAHVSREPALRLHTFAGKLAPLHCTAMGKALLVDRSEGEVRELMAWRGMESHTAHTLTSIETLLADLARARTRGYTMEREELQLGEMCLAAPLRLPALGAPTAISISVPLHDVAGDREVVLGRALLDAVYEITHSAA
jgi:DNA-binding IclR family transcriptional regulator